MFWIIKNSNHRGIKIYTGKENLDVEGTFVQEFIKDPLLISGKYVFEVSLLFSFFLIFM